MPKQLIKRLFYAVSIQTFSLIERTPMLLNIILKNISIVKKHETLLKIFLLFLAGASLYPQLIDNKMMSKESLYDCIELPKDFLLEAPKEYVTQTPNQTILIICDKNDAKLDPLIEKILRLKIRTRSIQICDSNINENYFCKIELRSAGNTATEIHPLKNLQPNSDLIYLACSIFGYKLSFSFKDLFYQSFDNILKVNIEPSEEGHRKILELLQLLMNIETHVYGLYYYIPLGNKIIRAEYCAIFMIIIIIYTFADDSVKCNNHLLILLTICYILMPASILFQLKGNGITPKIIIFGIFNFKFGFIYCVLYYIKIIFQKVCGILFFRPKLNC